MKYLFILLLPLCVLAQNQRDSVVRGNRVFYYGEYYVDSVWVDLDKTFLDRHNILQIVQLKNTEAYATHKTGAILITRKEKTPLIRFDAFIKNSESLRAAPKVNIIVNEKLTEHPEGYFIEESAIAKITILQSSDEVRNDHLWHPPSIFITLKEYK
jgi:hypothetical protein